MISICGVFEKERFRFQINGVVVDGASFAILVSQSTDVHVRVMDGVESGPVVKSLMNGGLKITLRLSFSHLAYVVGTEFLATGAAAGRAAE